MILLALLVAGCEDTDYLKYDSRQKDKIYFSEETVKFEYGFRMDNPIDLTVPVEVIGFVDIDKDNVFSVRINQELTTAVEGVHFKLLDHTVILKDSAQGVVNLDFIKVNLEMDQLYTLTLDLFENETYLPTDRKRCTISFGNLAIPAPAWWYSGRLGNTIRKSISYLWNYFTKQKI